MPHRIRFDRQTSRIAQVLEIARAGNIHAAARALNITQSALTKSLQAFERQLGVTLFDRGSAGTAPTPYGTALLHHARVIEAEFRAAERALEEIRSGEGGMLRIAAGPVWLSHVLPKVAARLRRGPGGLLLSCTQVRPPDPVAGLIDNACDVLCSMVDRRLRTDPAFVVKPKARFGMCLLVAASHPLASVRATEILAQAVRYPFVLFEQNWTMNRKLADHLERKGLPQPPVAMRTDSILSTLGMIRETDCIGFIAAPVAKLADLRDLRALPLDTAPFRTEVGLMHRRAIAGLGALRRFEAEVDRVLAELGLSLKG